MQNVVAIDWQGWATFSGSSLAALITSIAALIASIAAYRNSKKKDNNCDHD